jgi:hypothetical protein
MKKITQSAIVVSLIMTIWSCNPKKVESEIVKDSVKTEVETIKDTIVTEDSKEISKTVEGKVLEINNGKDGYTAKIETKDKEIYFVTISHSNLKNQDQYKTFKVGEELNVSGDFWQMDTANQITVRSIN